MITPSSLLPAPLLPAAPGLVNAAPTPGAAPAWPATPAASAPALQPLRTRWVAFGEQFGGQAQHHRQHWWA